MKLKMTFKSGGRTMSMEQGFERVAKAFKKLHTELKTQKRAQETYVDVEDAYRNYVKYMFTHSVDISGKKWVDLSKYRKNERGLGSRYPTGKILVDTGTLRDSLRLMFKRMGGKTLSFAFGTDDPRADVLNDGGEVQFTGESKRRPGSKFKTVAKVPARQFLGVNPNSKYGRLFLDQLESRAVRALDLYVREFDRNLG